VLAIVIATVSVVWVGLFATLLVQLYQQGDGVVDADLKLLAEALARFSSVDSSPQNIVHIATQLRDLNAARSQPSLGEDEFAFAVTDAKGTVLAASSAVPFGEDGDLGRIGTTTRTQFKNWNVIGSWSPDKKLFAAVGQANQFYERANIKILSDTLRTYLVSMLILTVVIWIAVRVGLRPLNEIAERIEQIPAGSLAPVFPKRKYVELLPLVKALNERVAQVERVLRRERTFFADAAHELRTPLAALEAQASVLALESDPAARKLAAKDLEAAVSRSANVLNKLLTAARVESLEGLQDVSEVDFSTLVTDTVSMMAPRVFAEGKQIELERLEQLVVRGDVNSLRLVLENLLDNSIRYTPVGTTIKVRLSHLVRGGANLAQLTVADNGPGIPPTERERVFERFVRLGDDGRTGSGLGLAIVKRVVELHAGTIRIEDATNDARPSGTNTSGGACFVVELPLN
jgi:signal transduction histidine kinase